MEAEFLHETKAKKEKKEGAYSFLDGIEDFVEEEPSEQRGKRNGEEDKSQEAASSIKEKPTTKVGRPVDAETGAVELNLFASEDSEDEVKEREAKEKLFKAVKTRIEKKKKGFDYSYLEGLKGEISSDELAKVFTKREEKGVLKRGAAANLEAEQPKGETNVKLGGLMGKILSGDLRPSTTGQEDGLSGLLDHERSTQIGKEITGEVIERGKGFKIIKRKGEKSLNYIVSMPDFSKEDKKLLSSIGRRAIAQIDLDPEAMQNYSQKKKLFTERVIELMDREYIKLKKEKKLWFAAFIVQDMIGYGILDPLLSNDALEEVMLIATNMPVYVYHRKHGMCKTNILFDDDEGALKIISRIARAVGRRVDASTPLLDARLKDGSRVNATVAPVSLGGPSLTIRKFKADPFTVVDVINFSTMSFDLAAFLWLAIDGYEVKPANILVSGGTGSGKTTTLNCLGSFIPQSNRVISIEDTAELQLPVNHWVRLETRPPNIEGSGEISMERLLRNTLRMRPDRIIVGEVRGAEANTLLTAMNTGQSGSMGTLHANNSKETITRLINKPMSVPILMMSALNLIIMQNRFTHRGKTVRRITEVTEIMGVKDGHVKLSNIFEWDPKTDSVKATGVPSRIKNILAEKRGVEIKDIDDEIARRKSVLEFMVKNEVHGVKEVGRLINEYYVDPEAFQERIDSGFEKPKEAQKSSKTASKGIVDLFATSAKNEVLEKTSLAEIIKIESEKNPVYNVFLPKLSKEDKRLLKEIETRVIDKLDVDPSKIENKQEAEVIFAQKIQRFINNKYSLGPAKTRDFTKHLVNNLTGYGILEPLLKDEKLEEIMVIGTGRSVYISHSKYDICRTNLVFDEDEEIERILERIAAAVGRRIDRASPLLDARLVDGSRVNATLPPISIDGPTLTVRKFKEDPLTIVDLINFNTLTTEISAYLWYAVEGSGIKPGNILVAGGSGSGKTTTLNCLCSYIPDTERIITIEDTAELQLPATHWVRLETKPPNVEGKGEVDMDELVKNTLRMRPDRVIVGEVRGPEARTLFTAMNTGHDGSMGTLHSNSARETITRLTNPPMSVPHIMMPALDLILMENKIYFKGTTVRRITEIAEVTEESGEGEEAVVLNNVYKWNPKTDTLESTGIPSVLKQKLARIQGVSLKDVDKEIDRRKRVLDYMVKTELKNIEGVGKIFGRYYSDSDELIKEIEVKKDG
jgi:flagellar protein FlaI